MTTANSSRVDDKNIEQMYEEYGQEEPFDEFDEYDDFDDFDDEYGAEPTYERMNNQKGLKKMRW